jgi:hypothetical protein
MDEITDREPVRHIEGHSSGGPSLPRAEEW